MHGNMEAPDTGKKVNKFEAHTTRCFIIRFESGMCKRWNYVNYIALQEDTMPIIKAFLFWLE
jgi:hypothetical protein